MKIDRIEINNFRCFEHIEIKFGGNLHTIPKVSALIAKNGEGKTSILDAISIGLATFSGIMPDSSKPGFKISDIRYKKNKFEQKYEAEDRPSVTIDIKGNENLHDCTVTRRLSNASKKPTTTTSEAKEIEKYAILLKKNEDKNDILFPILAYYGDNRLWADNVITKGHKNAILATSRIYGYADSMNPRSGYKEFALWFSKLKTLLFREIAKQSMGEYVDKKALDFYNICNKLVTEVLSDILSISGWNHIDFDNVKEEIVAKNTNTGCEVSVRYLSAGIKAVLGVVADIAYRCCKLNPGKGLNALKETPGIVLVDEVELHLHPAWQQIILSSLSKNFPSIQFIVTTHSPHIISSIPKESVIIIDSNDSIYPESQTKGIECQDILSQIFGTFPVSQEIDEVKMLKKYMNIISKRDFSNPEIQDLKEKLTDHFGPDHPMLKAADFYSKFARDLKK